MWQRAVLGGAIWLVAASGVQAQSYRSAAFVEQLYETYFGREPFYSELDYWVDRMERRGHSRIVVEAGIIGSPAYFQQNKYNTTRWIRDVYRRVLGRRPSDDELDWWIRRLARLHGDREEWALEFLDEMTGRGRRVERDRYAYRDHDWHRDDDWHDRYRDDPAPRARYKYWDQDRYRDAYGARDTYRYRRYW